MFVTRGTEYHVLGPSLRNSGRKSGFRRIPEQIILAPNDLISTCIPTESGNSTEFSGIPGKEAGPEPEKKSECTTKLLVDVVVGHSHHLNNRTDPFCPNFNINSATYHLPLSRQCRCIVRCVLLLPWMTVSIGNDSGGSLQRPVLFRWRGSELPAEACLPLIRLL